MDECWIMQNSWGRGSGWDGFYFFHNDPDCDGGVVSLGGAIIPIFEKVEKESTTTVPLDMTEKEETESTTALLDTNATKPSTTSSGNDETSGAGGMIKSYFLFAVANVALFAMFA